jgi:hypothetical protein
MCVTTTGNSEPPLRQQQLSNEQKQAWFKTEFQAFVAAYLVGTVVLSNLLSEHNDGGVSFHLLVHRHLERITHCNQLHERPQSASQRQ